MNNLKDVGIVPQEEHSVTTKLNYDKCIDSEKFSKSQQRYKERKNGSKFRTVKLNSLG